VHGVEPLADNDGQLSLAKGELVKVKSGKTIADGAISGTLGELTFPIIKQNVSSILTVTDE